MQIKRAHLLMVNAMVKFGLLVVQIFVSRMVWHVENLLPLVTQ